MNRSGDGHASILSLRQVVTQCRELKEKHKAVSDFLIRNFVWNGFPNPRKPFMGIRKSPTAPFQMEKSERASPEVDGIGSRPIRASGGKDAFLLFRVCKSRVLFPCRLYRCGLQIRKSRRILPEYKSGRTGCSIYKPGLLLFLFIL